MGILEEKDEALREAAHRLHVSIHNQRVWLALAEQNRALVSRTTRKLLFGPEYEKKAKACIAKDEAAFAKIKKALATGGRVAMIELD